MRDGGVTAAILTWQAVFPGEALSNSSSSNISQISLQHHWGLTRAYPRLHLSAMQPDSDHTNPQDQPDLPAEETFATEDTMKDNQSPDAELDPWEQLEADAAKWKELSLRTAAEMDNLRKRTARDKEEAVRYANQRLLEDLLPVIDNFDMGMQAASQDQKSMIYIGMDMVRRQLYDFLASQGVQEIPTDILFDPNLHDAVAQEDCAKGEEGRILKVTRKGYKLRDRLLRPASVVVSKLPNSSEA